MSDQKLEQRNIPGMNARANRFSEVEHAENFSATLKRIIKYFTNEKILLISMLLVVVLEHFVVCMHQVYKVMR